MTENDHENLEETGQPDSGTEAAKSYDLSSFRGTLELFADELSEDEVKEHVVKQLAAIVKRHKLEDYTILYLYDEHRSIDRYHANQLYQAISGRKKEADILLVVSRGGGRVEPAYL